ncbi:MAG: hypothetical protein ACMUFK_05110, partial [Thermoplasmatota archaeon]
PQHDQYYPQQYPQEGYPQDGWGQQDYQNQEAAPSEYPEPQQQSYPVQDDRQFREQSGSGPLNEFFTDVPPEPEEGQEVAEGQAKADGGQTPTASEEEKE